MKGDWAQSQLDEIDPDRLGRRVRPSRPETPECEDCHRTAQLRVNGIYVCVDHADRAAEEEDNEVEVLR